MAQQQERFAKQRKLIVGMGIICFVIIIAVIVFGWYAFDYSSTKIRKNNEAVAALLKNSNLQNKNSGDNAQTINFDKKEQIDYQNLKAADVILMVSRHILLADGEITVATVTNIDGLRADYPELFTYAKTGDKLIFYPLGIIIYDPVLDRVIDVMRRLPADTVIPGSVTEEK